jgi:ABC-2 type transport system ATP-binding protein
MENLIEVRDLRKRFGALIAVDGVSLNIPRGEVLGFLGPNGAGKSTTMKMITGFIAPTSGAVSICGHDVGEDPMAAKRKIGYLPEGAPAYGEMTPASFLDFIADIRGLTGAHKTARIREVVEQINLGGVLDQSIETLSKGFKRRVGLAQAILHDPEVLILDEPTDGLDPNQKHEVRSLIHAMAPSKAIIISTHILEEVDAVCTRAAIIAKGKLLFLGTPAELAARSQKHNAVSLTVAADAAETIRNELAALGQILEVQTSAPIAGRARLTALARNGAYLFDVVQETVRQRGWPVAELYVEPGHLDEVFRTITMGARAPGEVAHT